MHAPAHWHYLALAALTVFALVASPAPPPRLRTCGSTSRRTSAPRNGQPAYGLPDRRAGDPRLHQGRRPLLDDEEMTVAHLREIWASARDPPQPQDLPDQDLLDNPRVPDPRAKYQ